MRYHHLILTLGAAALHAAPEDEHVNFIRQVQQNTGVEWDVTVPAEGEQFSPAGVSPDGSFFQLWSIRNSPLAEYLLDEQFVTAYTPNATVDIVTDDPYGPIRRTRVDQPFQVRITVGGLIDPSDPSYDTAPDASKYVEYIHSTFAYPDGEHSFEGVSDPVGTVIEEGWMEESAATTVTFAMSNLTGTDLTAVEGEEVFTIYSQEDFGVTATVLDSDRVVIWPMAKGTVGGLDPTAYYDDVPSATVTLTDLYPSSTTYLRLYPGAASASPTNVSNVVSSYVVIEDSIPQDRVIVLKDLDDYCAKEGLHTLEVMHLTPFGSDLLWQGSIQVDRTISFKGGIYSGK